MKNEINIMKTWNTQPMNKIEAVVGQIHYVDFKFWVS